jgi:hypothetical protein
MAANHKLKLAGLTGRRGSCRSRKQHQRCRAERNQKITREERETKAADPLKVCATVRVTLFRLVPRASKGRGSSSERFH